MTALLAEFRRHRVHLPPLTNLYPYAMGRIEGVLNDPLTKPAAKVKAIRQIIDALDRVEAEPKPTRLVEPQQCPDCGVGFPGHGAHCSRAPTATLGIRQ